VQLNRELTIEDLGGGAILERLEHELQEVIADCFDVNKVPDSAREISCKIKIKPNRDRSILEIKIETGNKLGKRHHIQGMAIMDAYSKTAFEPTAKENDMFDLDGKPNISVIGGRQ
jgi:hypothetical protein